MPELSFTQVEEILGLLREVGDADVELRWGDLHLQVRRTVEAPVPGPPVAPSTAPAATEEAREPDEPPTASASPSPGPPSSEGEDATPGSWQSVRAPMSGTFYRSPTPADPPYVQVGDEVAADDTVALVEVMKLFTDLKAGVAGRVVRVDGEDGALVEHEQALVWIEPA